MATNPTSTAPAELSTIKTIAVLLTPVWIILAVVVNALASGEIAL